LAESLSPRPLPSSSPSSWDALIRSADEEALLQTGIMRHEKAVVTTLVARTVFLLVLGTVLLVALYAIFNVIRSRASLGRVKKWFTSDALARSNCGALAPAPFPTQPGRTYCGFNCIVVNLFYPSLASALTIGVADFYIGPERARFLVHILTWYGAYINRRAWAGDPSVAMATYLLPTTDAHQDRWCAWSQDSNPFFGLFSTPAAFNSSTLCNKAAENQQGSDLALLFRAGLCGWAREQTEDASAQNLLELIFAAVSPVPPKMDCSAQQGLAIMSGVTSGATVASTVATIGLALPFPFNAVVSVAGVLGGLFLGYGTSSSGAAQARAECGEADVKAEVAAAVRWCIGNAPIGDATEAETNAYCDTHKTEMVENAIRYASACAGNPRCDTS